MMEFNKPIAELTAQERAAILRTIHNHDQLVDSAREASELFDEIRELDEIPATDAVIRFREIWIRHSTQPKLDGFIGRNVGAGDGPHAVALKLCNSIRGWCAIWLLSPKT